MINKENLSVDEHFAGFPKIDEYLKLLVEFDKINLTEKSIKEIDEIYFRYAPFIPQVWFGQKIERFNNRKLYRARLNIDPAKENLDSVNTYSYPSSALCTKNGRANVKGKSVFYCTDNATASILESKPQNEDLGYLSIWKPDATREIKFQYCLPPFLRTDNEWNEIRKDIYPTISKHLFFNVNHKRKHYLALLNYLFYKFRDEKYPYPLSSWLADKYLFGKNWIDIILYPSMASHQKYCNMAINPNTVDNNLKFEKVIKFKIIEVTAKNIKYSPIKVGELLSHNIVWRKPNSDEKEFARLE